MAVVNLQKPEKNVKNGYKLQLLMRNCLKTMKFGQVDP